MPTKTNLLSGPVETVATKNDPKMLNLITDKATKRGQSTKTNLGSRLDVEFQFERQDSNRGCPVHEQRVEGEKEEEERKSGRS